MGRRGDFLFSRGNTEPRSAGVTDVNSCYYTGGVIFNILTGSRFTPNGRARLQVDARGAFRGRGRDLPQHFLEPVSRMRSASARVESVGCY